MKYLIRSELGFHMDTPATLILNVEPAKTPHQSTENERLHLEPSLSYEAYEMPDSLSRYLRLSVQPGDLRLIYEGTIELQAESYDPIGIPEVPIRQVPLALLPYLAPSRYVQSDVLFRLARIQFGNYPPGYSRVTAICNWIYDNVHYVRGSTDAHTSVSDTLVARAGVCRDFAHLGIAFCRALSIPARYASGYATGVTPPDFHAVFEAYLGGRWYLFDATRQAALGSFVRIGLGRDATEVALATTFGVVTMIPPVVSIQPLDEAVGPTTAAITTSAA